MLRILFALVLGILSVTSALAQSGYTVKSGDILQIEVLEDPSLNRSVLVLPGGSFDFPYVGTIQANGLTTDGIRGKLIAGLAANFAAAPTVFVTVAKLAEQGATAGVAAPPPGIPVYAMGEVARPGQTQVQPGTTLLQFLASSGGFTKFAATNRVQLRRVDRATGRESVYVFNYKKGGGIPGTTVLQSGDVIIVPERGLFE